MHRSVDGYGQHRHLYLHDTMRDISRKLRATKSGELPTWLDYGCGKGRFLKEMEPLKLFSAAVGYDPAVDAFHRKPAGTYDLVTCLDVLDMVEQKYIEAVLDDVARYTAGLAVFDCFCRPKASSSLKRHAPFYWSYLVGRRMRVLETKVEFPGMESFERAIITAVPT